MPKLVNPKTTYAAILTAVFGVLSHRLPAYADICNVISSTCLALLGVSAADAQKGSGSDGS